MIITFYLLSVWQDGATPLMLAAQMSRVELCVFLLGRGADANIQDNQGRYWTVGDTQSGFDEAEGAVDLDLSLVAAAAEALTDGLMAC